LLQKKKQTNVVQHVIAKRKGGSAGGGNVTDTTQVCRGTTAPGAGNGIKVWVCFKAWLFIR